MDKPFTDFSKATTGSVPRAGRDTGPVIGLSVNIAEENSRLHEAYIRAVTDAGGVPLLIPASTDAGVLSVSVEMIDGLILTGGADVGGEYFGEHTHASAEVIPFRDAYDFLLLKLAADRQLPVLGICRGMQVINIAYGGTIWQDLPTQYPREVLKHSVLQPREKPCHEVAVSPATVLCSILGEERLGVNSRHHQAVKEVAPGFRVSATAPDGVVEAIEAYPCYRIMGVQWHPENLAAEGGDEGMKNLFRFFVSEAGLFRAAKRIHQNYLTVDSHCDTPMLFENHSVDIGRRDPVARVDLVKMEEGMLDVQFVVAYIPQGECDENGHDDAKRQSLAVFDEMRRQVKANREYAALARTFAEARSLKKEGRKAIFPGLENGYAVGRDLDNIAMLRDLGVVYITLCHNGANDICDSAKGLPRHGGLSEFGRDVVRQMNRLGVVIDLSHAAETTFYDVLKESAVPVICSHSSARALCDHPRNLTDGQIQAIAAKGGVVQVCLFDGFLSRDRRATITDALEHIEYIINLVGADYVGIGSDFDGGGGIPGCNGANEIINITVELLRRGHPESDIAKLLGGNIARVVDAVQAKAQR